MIYGINFNGTQIPEGFARKFRKDLRLPATMRADTGRRKATTIPARLVGVADSSASRDAMLIQADNGHRKLHVVERKTAGPTLWGIYVY